MPTKELGPRRIRISLPWLSLVLALAVLYVPTALSLAQTLWLRDDQSQGPVVLAVVLWLFWDRRERLQLNPATGSQVVFAWGAVVLALVAYTVGRSQGIWMLEVGSAIPLLAGLLTLLCGLSALPGLAFPLFFLVFLVPLPGALVDALTQPMKLAVSYGAESLLYALGYPVSRTGVILQVGPYQLLVADACAGLHTLFTLEAMGLLYLNVVRHASMLRNVTLAVLIVPIGFVANVVRVIVLCLVTYHLGDEAGQGFLHGFAGMVLFVTALLMIIATDSALRRLSARGGPL